MRGATATLFVVLLALTVTTMLAGCKEEATTATDSPAVASAPETEDPHAGHDHAAHEDEPGETDGPVPKEVPKMDPSTAIGEDGQVISAEGVVPLLESSDFNDNAKGIQQAQQMRQNTQLEKIRDPVRAILMRPETPPAVLSGAATLWAAWVREDAEPLLSIAQHTDPGVRAAVARTLQFSTQPGVRKALEILKDDEDSSIAAVAATSLGMVLAKMGDPESIRQLIADLGQPAGDRSAQAAMQLEQRGRKDRAVIPLLAETLAGSTSPAQRASCATVIAMTCAGASDGQMAFADTLNAVYRTAAAPDPAYEEPVPVLVDALASDPDPMVREACAQALGTIGSAGSAEALGKALSDPDPYVRRRAASALIIVPSASVLSELIDASQYDTEKSAPVRRYAIEAMANQSDNLRDAAIAVSRCVHDPDAEVRRYAAEVLGQIGTHLEANALFALFDDVDEDVRWKAVEAMAKMVFPDAREALEKALWDPSPRVSLAAKEGLHKLGIAKAVPGRDEREMRRRAAAARKAANKGEDKDEADAEDGGDEVSE